MNDDNQRAVLETAFFVIFAIGAAVGILVGYSLGSTRRSTEPSHSRPSEPGSYLPTPPTNGMDPQQ